MPQQTAPLAENLAPPQRASAPAGSSGRIVLIRHGQPRIAIAPRASHHGFRSYIGDYEEAGLDPGSLPPAALRELARDLKTVFTSGRKRPHESAALLAPAARAIAEPLFVEAPLAAPPIPLLRMRVTKWAVVARLLWHAGYHPGIEDYARARTRARQAADILIARMAEDGVAVLVAHGYFNFLIGRELQRRGFRRTGLHRAKFWNAVTYEKGQR